MKTQKIRNFVNIAQNELVDKSSIFSYYCIKRSVKYE